MTPCLTLSIIRYGSRVKWRNPGLGVAPSRTPWCSSYRKGNLRVTLDYGRQLYFNPLADGLSLDFEWQQVSSSHQDSSRYSGRFNNAVVWMVSTCPPTSKSSSPFNSPFVNVPNAIIAISTIVTFIFHSFFNSLARSRYLSFFSLSFSFILWSAGTAKSTILQVLYFCVDFHKVWSSGRD